MLGILDFETTKKQSTQLQRRQNASCDPCRRSKRRCVFPTRREGESDSAAVCSNCERLGTNCTLNFAKSRATNRPRRKQKHHDNFNNFDQQRELNGSPRALGNPGLTSNAVYQPEAHLTTSRDAWEPWLELNFDDFLNEDDPCLEENNLNTQPHSLVPDLQLATAPQLDIQCPTPRGWSVRHNYSQYRAAVAAGVSPNSPVCLLNSGLNSQILEDRLVRIYETIVTGSSSRFLHHKCNLYASRSPYRLHREEPTFLDSQKTVTSPGTVSSTPITLEICEKSPLQSSVLHGGAYTQSPQGPEEVDPKMTVLGAVRFLDHFGHLYGNRMGVTARRKSDAVLKAVLKVFTLQWLPVTSTGFECGLSTSQYLSKQTQDGRQLTQNTQQNAFIEAWFIAKSLLKDAADVESFRVVFAMVMFDGIAIPAKALVGLNDFTLKHELLDTALQKLCYLNDLVQSHCNSLGPSSKYAALLKASLSVVRWGAYVRDTGAALTENRTCKLPDILNHNEGPSSYLEVKGNVAGMCRKGFAEAFSAWRQIIKVRSAILKVNDASSQIFSDTVKSITLALSAVDGINQWLRPFMADCMDNFVNLAISSRKFCVSFVMAWDLGIFILAESLKSLESKLQNCLPMNVLNMEPYLQEAISSTVRTVECILTVRPEETLMNLQNGLNAETSILNHHITPGLMVTALEKAIEMIARHTPNAPPNLDTPVGGKMQMPSIDGARHRRIDILMKALLSFDVTLGGSESMKTSLQYLLQRYGDILLECWSSDFET